MNIYTKITGLSALLSTTLFLTGCPDGIAPEAKLTFPSKASLTDANTILVEGSASLYQSAKIKAYKEFIGEEPSTIAAIRINGINATSENGFLTWQASVPLTDAKNTFVIETEDSDGDIDLNSNTFYVRQEKTLIPNPLAVDFILGTANTNDQLIVAGNITNSLFRVDLNTGERNLITGQGVGSGPEIGNLLDFVLDASGETGYVADVSNNVVIGVDIATGERKIISGGDIGAGPEIMGRARALTFDEGNNRLLSAGTLDLDGTVAFALFSIDLNTGDRTIISDDITFDDPALTLTQPFRIVVDNENNRALVYVWKTFVSDVDRRTGAIVSVNLTDGNRTLISDVNIGSGPQLTGSLGTALAPFDNTLLFSAEPAKEQIISTDLTTGNRTTLASGSALGSPFGLAADPTNNLLYSAGNRGIYSIQINDGQINNISDFNIGSGPVISSAQRIIANKNKDKAIIIDREIRSLFMVDLQNGSREILSNDKTGEGNSFIFPSQIQWDEAGKRAFVTDIALETNEDDGFDGSTIIRQVNLVTGDRSVLIGSDNNNTSECGTPIGQIWDTQNNRLIVITAENIVSLEPDTGTCSIISSFTDPTPLSLTDIEIDNANNRLIASGSLDSTLGILSIDIETAKISFISGNNIGEGEAFDVTGGAIGGLSLDAKNNRVLVTSFNSRLASPRVRSIVNVDLNTGNRTTISSNIDRNGPIFGEMNDVATDQQGNILLLDGAMDAIYLVNSKTGERVLFSR